jgi:hypothetical protein
MKTRIASFSILALVGLLLTAIAAQTKTIPLALVSPAIRPQATNPRYLSEMPTVERVMREVQGKYPADTAARRVATFRQLCRIISDMARASEGR